MKTDTEIEYLDRPPPGWFVLSVMRTKGRGWDWCALMIDVHPADLRAGGASHGISHARRPVVQIRGLIAEYENLAPPTLVSGECCCE
jgi:hypothetical protein